MQRAAIYARFSTDLQNEKSTEDQIELCKSFCRNRGFDIVGVYQDQAKSGASIHGRDGVAELISEAMRGNFDAIIVEALDRLSRDMEDMSGIYKRLSFAGVELIPVDTGRPANTVEVGLRGLISQLYREDNVHKVRRGMAGLVRNNLSAGGKVYGYTNDPLNKGQLLIVEDEAAVVRRIFEEYANGKSPKAMCHDFNREGIKPPRGKLWGPSTIVGFAERGSGILRNSVYVGVRTWNKVMMIKNPMTGRRVSRVNDADKIQSSEVPHLRLIDDEVWGRVQARLGLNAKAKHFSHTRRPKRLLSGLLRCGACGSGLQTFGKDRSGKVRLRCAAHTGSGSCPDPRTFYLEPVERMVLDSLAHHLDEPDLLYEYFKTYDEEKRRLRAEKNRKKGSMEKKLDATTDELNRLVNFIATGSATNFASIGKRMDELAEQQKQLEAEIAACDSGEDNVRLHPSALRKMCEEVVSVRNLLHTQTIDGDDPSAQIIRSIISKVTVYRDGGGFRIAVEGRLNALTDEGVCVKAVAEVRSSLYAHTSGPVFSYTYAAPKHEA